MAKDEISKGKSVGAVLNALTILRFVSNQGVPVGVNQVSRGTGVSVSTCFNILGTLLQDGLVNFDGDSKTYSPGLGLLELATPLLGTNPADLVTPEIVRLSGEHHCLVCVWNFTVDHRIVLANRVSPSKTVSVDMKHGSRLPAYAGAVGRCYAARVTQSDDAVRDAFAEVTWQTAPRVEDFVADVRAARQEGYAFDFGQLFNGLEVAAAIAADGSGRPRYGLSGISIAGQMSETMLRRMAVDLRQVADRIERALFGADRKTSTARRSA